MSAAGQSGPQGGGQQGGGQQAQQGQQAQRGGGGGGGQQAQRGGGGGGGQQAGGGQQGQQKNEPAKPGEILITAKTNPFSLKAPNSLDYLHITELKYIRESLNDTLFRRVVLVLIYEKGKKEEPDPIIKLAFSKEKPKEAKAADEEEEEEEEEEDDENKISVGQDLKMELINRGLTCLTISNPNEIKPSGDKDKKVQLLPGNPKNLKEAIQKISERNYHPYNWIKNKPRKYNDSLLPEDAKPDGQLPMLLVYKGGFPVMVYEGPYGDSNTKNMDKGFIDQQIKVVQKCIKTFLDDIGLTKARNDNQPADRTDTIKYPTELNNDNITLLNENLWRTWYDNIVKVGDISLEEFNKERGFGVIDEPKVLPAVPIVVKKEETKSDYERFLESIFYDDSKDTSKINPFNLQYYPPITKLLDKQKKSEKDKKKGEDEFPFNHKNFFFEIKTKEKKSNVEEMEGLLYKPKFQPQKEEKKK